MSAFKNLPNTVNVIQGLLVPAHDYVSLSYTGTNVTGITYKEGGSGGITVATLALTYDESNNLLTITRS
jgi:hypothetical protein